MQLTFWGAAQTVTGSMHLLELDTGTTMLLDCGLFQGRRADAWEINSTFPRDPRTIDFVLLSHAHIDHAGLLPALYKQGFRGRIYATHATYDLCELMLLDSAYIQEKDVEFVNRKHRKHGEKLVEPLYSVDDAEAVLHHFVGVGYGVPFSPVPELSVEYRDAGHILGSASMTLTIREGGKTTKLGFTGDVGRPDRLIIRDPVPMEDCDYLISESTYGGKTHHPASESKQFLADVINRTAARGGKVLIPAFSVGRTQEIVHTLDQLWNEEALPEIPVYVDSPLSVDVTAVFQSHPECYDRDLQQYLLHDSNPFGFRRLKYLRSVEQSMSLNDQSMPMVIISSSGMCEAGRILHHLRNNIDNPRTTVMMVGYCAEHTLGRRLIEKQRTVRIFGESHRVRAEIVTMNSYSAHADQPELLDFLGHLDRDRIETLFLVHGDAPRQEILGAALRRQGYSDVQAPMRGEHFVL